MGANHHNKLRCGMRELKCLLRAMTVVTMGSDVSHEAEQCIILTASAKDAEQASAH